MPLSLLDQASYSSAELPAWCPDRSAEVERRHQLLAEFLALRGDDAVLLQRASNIAWLTCGGDVHRCGSCQSAAAVFVTPEARVLLCNNVDSQQLFDGPLAGLGFQLKERPWHEGREKLLADVSRGRKVVSDAPLEGCRVVDGELSQFRRRLNALEEPLLRELGRDLSHAVEATCRTCDEGLVESQVAGQVMHRLCHHQVAPVRVQVSSDGRGARYRHWGYTDAPIRRFAALTVIGRRNGLHLGVSRTICFGEPPETLAEAHKHATLVLATGSYFSQPGWAIRDAWNRVARIYEKFGAEDEWQLADQGAVMGYEGCESPISPASEERLSAGQPVFWNPSVQSGVAGDSVLVRDEGLECLTLSKNWPQLCIQVKGAEITLPSILRRTSTPAL